MCRVLLVDDDPDVRELVRETLGRAGHSVLEAADLGAAVALLDGARPDVVLLDLDLPGGSSGLDLLPELARRACEAPVIVLTASGETTRATALARGVAYYLTKPFSPLELLTRIDDARRA